MAPPIIPSLKMGLHLPIALHPSMQEWSRLRRLPSQPNAAVCAWPKLNGPADAMASPSDQLSITVDSSLAAASPPTTSAQPICLTLSLLLVCNSTTRLALPGNLHSPARCQYRPSAG